MTARTFPGVVLVGFMGSGKSSVGREIAQRTGAGFVDIDAWIENKEGRAIWEIFSEDGEAAFRSIEKAALGEILAVKGQVVAAGGGAFLDKENQKLMRAYAPVVYLEVKAETALRRLEGNIKRPLLQVEDRDAVARTLLDRRIPEYSRADYAVSTDESTVPDIASRIIDFLEKQGGGSA
ncbi:MAG: shikimate kinase [Syntrophorhabdaceae bacterium]|nr:shikimate kinase [Syntrophorhabdaceae bacterium]